MWLNAFSNRFDQSELCSVWLDCSRQALVASGSDFKIWSHPSHFLSGALGPEEAGCLRLEHIVPHRTKWGNAQKSNYGVNSNESRAF